MGERGLDVIAVGEAMIEFNQTEPDRPLYLQGFGGDTSNAMIAAARSGGRAGYITRLGADMFGEALMALWRREGVDTRGVQVDEDAGTGIYFVTHGDAGHRFTYRRSGSAASLMRPDHVPEALIADSRVLHVSGISQAISESAEATVSHAIARARALGTMVSYDPNLRPSLWPLARAKAIVEATLAKVDIVLPSLDDARLLTGTDDPDIVLDRFLDPGPSLVALTLGERGVAVATRGRREHFSLGKVEAVDATGAGDAFDGAFLVEYLGTGDAFRAARYGMEAAALATQGFGAVAPIPRRAQVLARLEADVPGNQ